MLGVLRQGCQEVASKITGRLAELKPKARNMSLSQQTVQSRETKWLLSKGGSSLLVLWQKRLCSLYGTTCPNHSGGRGFLLLLWLRC